jgi:hypothetical protein
MPSAFRKIKALHEIMLRIRQEGCPPPPRPLPLPALHGTVQQLLQGPAKLSHLLQAKPIWPKNRSTEIAANFITKTVSPSTTLTT